MDRATELIRCSLKPKTEINNRLLELSWRFYPTLREAGVKKNP